MENTERYKIAAALLKTADGLLITAGAGMGVDSGLPDFRGDEGLWNVYPALKNANLSFTKIANPSAFVSIPEIAWGFYGHRLQLYREVTPHVGFKILREMSQTMRNGAFIFTSNVDGHFQKAGFDEKHVVECHGSIHHQQCSGPCNLLIRSAANIEVDIDAEQCLWKSALPRCKHCGDVMRPNILMFNDYSWISTRTDQQIERMRDWIARVNNLVVIEIGAGRAIPTVRNQSERLQKPVIRINPIDFSVRHRRSIGLDSTALIGLQGIFEEFLK